MDNFFIWDFANRFDFEKFKTKMDEAQLMLTELPGGGGVISRHHHHFHRYAPYHLHQPHLSTVLYQPQPHHQRIVPQRPKTPIPSPPPEGTHIGHLLPEILTMIFAKLNVCDKGRAAQVCSAWRDAAYSKSVWKGTEAKLHLRRVTQTFFSSLVQRGIRKIQILSLRRPLKEVIVGVPNLESLNVSGCYNVTDMNLSLAFSSDLPNLKILDLSLCKQITDSSTGRIAQYLKNLEVLELGGCSNITNTSLLLIAWGLKKLKRLNLRSCWNLSDQGIGHLAGMSKELSKAEGNPALEYLGLQDCQRLTDEALKHIAEGLTSLKVINLSFCVSITDSGLKYLAKMLTLEELNLRACDNISDIGIAYLTEGGSRISSLDVSFCDKIGDQALQHLSQGLFHLKSLSLSACNITDDGLKQIAKSVHELETLNIGQCQRITDVGLKSISEQLVNLKAIDLYGCVRLTTEGLELIMKMPKLEKLNLGLWHRR